MSPRLLAIMGSGETAPTMVKTHRALLDRAGPGVAVLLDTPYGFQENADIVSSRAVEYFQQSVGRPMDVASFRSSEVDTLTRETALAKVRAASYVFAGPGSPTYALGVWRDTSLPDLLAEKLRTGGCVTFASAAALTLGLMTVPVYEIYKVGAVPTWERGLDLLAPAGLRAAVIPHYDNTEGGNHDTRFCYLGERRLQMLERDLPSGAFVLGVDEHTAAVLDLDDRTLAVTGNGCVTVRAGGGSTLFVAGATVGFDEVIAAAMDPGGSEGVRANVTRPSPVAARPAASPTGLLAEADRLDAAFAAALDERDVDGAVAALLELDQAIVDWSRDTLQSDEPDKARAVLRSMVVRLGEIARVGAQDPAATLAPFVDAMLEARDAARAEKDFATADRLRDRLVDAGVEVRDEAGKTTWSLPGGRLLP